LRACTTSSSTITNKQCTQPQKTDEDNHLHHGSKKGSKEEVTKKEKAPTVTQAKEPTSPQLNNEEKQKEEKRRMRTVTPLPPLMLPLPLPTWKILIPPKRKVHQLRTDIPRSWYYLAHTLKSAVWHKSMDRRKFNL
jgi:hypothetical protein